MVLRSLAMFTQSKKSTVGVNYTAPSLPDWGNKQHILPLWRLPRPWFPGGSRATHLTAWTLSWAVHWSPWRPGIRAIVARQGSTGAGQRTIPRCVVDSRPCWQPATTSVQDGLAARLGTSRRPRHISRQRLHCPLWCKSTYGRNCNHSRLVRVFSPWGRRFPGIRQPFWEEPDSPQGPAWLRWRLIKWKVLIWLVIPGTHWQAPSPKGVRLIELWCSSMFPILSANW